MLKGPSQAMGQEAKCTARVAGRKVEGRLHLESERLLFRSPDVRLSISIADINRSQSQGDKLIIAAHGQVHEFDLGEAAVRWARRIANPKSLAEKLGIKSGADVAFIGECDGALLALIKKEGAKVTVKGKGRSRDWIFVGVETPTDLKLLKGLDRAIKSNGAVWVIFPKGKTDLKDQNIIMEARANGFVDNKVARISERLTGLKFVIPVHRRG